MTRCPEYVTVKHHMPVLPSIFRGRVARPVRMTIACSRATGHDDMHGGYLETVDGDKLYVGWKQDPIERGPGPFA